jgi:hypothetical protein
VPIELQCRVGATLISKVSPCKLSIRVNVGGQHFESHQGHKYLVLCVSDHDLSLSSLLPILEISAKKKKQPCMQIQVNHGLKFLGN